VSEHGFAGKDHSVRHFARRLGQGRPLPFRRLECAPGVEAEVDFGTGVAILQANGKRRRTHVFRMVLSHSRKGYSEVVYRQTPARTSRAIAGTSAGSSARSAIITTTTSPRLA
jgi:hypothetical protein